MQKINWLDYTQNSNIFNKIRNGIVDITGICKKSSLKVKPVESKTHHQINKIATSFNKIIGASQDLKKSFKSDILTIWFF